jgi:hypothetical protein
MQALKTRVPCLCLHLGDNEMRALMWQIAARGYRHESKVMKPGECAEVCDYVIGETVTLDQPLNVRVLIAAFSYYLQWREGDARCHWTVLTAAYLRERAAILRSQVGISPRADDKAREQRIARDILDQTDDAEEQFRMWAERTGGKSRATWYRRKSEVERGDSQDSQIPEI